MSGKPGRPTTYTPEMAAKVCASLEETSSLRKTCEPDDMPPESTVRRWALDDVDGFAARYARARRLGYEALADELLDIADDGRNDTYVDGEGNERTDHDVIQRSRLRVDTRKWLLSKVLPKVYGEKLEVTGEDGGPIKHAVEVRFVEPDGDDEA